MAAGNGQYFRVGGSGSVQGVAQCVQDLSLSECQDCLSEAGGRLKSDCGAAACGDMYLGKCYVRYSGSYSSKTVHEGRIYQLKLDFASPFLQCNVGKSYICPELSPYDMKVSLSRINCIAGISLEAYKVAGLLNKMRWHVKQSVSENDCSFIVSVPPTRSDVLHACDVAEDMAIAYGFNNIEKKIPASLKPLPLNQFSDLLRTKIALCGYTEVLTWILCSYKENFSMLNRKDDNKTAVIIGNPRSADLGKKRKRCDWPFDQTLCPNAVINRKMLRAKIEDMSVQNLKSVKALGQFWAHEGQWVETQECEHVNM
ncbi:phenylalanine--tRNA ligase beta subunit, cytoplasmic-like [Bidens hawaiensis]|uniref:phenylalanine--tRNA ligase beta subunit, cytoplasmic-like n=1 Tax=Bidens hawaiensis TaxID=980011 RepID=UPI00404AF4B7